MVVVGLNRHGDVDYVNPHFTEVTGFKPEEALGKNWFERFVPERDRAELDSGSPVRP